MGSWKRSAILRYAAGSAHSAPSFTRSRRTMRNITKESEQRHGVAAGKRALARKEGREEERKKKRWETKRSSARKIELLFRFALRTTIRQRFAGCRLNPMEICAGSKRADRPLIPDTEDEERGKRPSSSRTWTPGWVYGVAARVNRRIFIKGASLARCQTVPFQSSLKRIGSNCWQFVEEYILGWQLSNCGFHS